MNRRLFLCIVVLISLTAVFARLAELPGVSMNNAKTWIEHAADGFAGGSGTQEAPYQIATAGQLAYLAKTVNEGNMYQDCYFEQTKKIDLRKYEWVPIGTRSGVYFMEPDIQGWRKGPPPFKGHFDGKNKTISRLNIKQFWGFSGLFGLTHGGSFKNIKLTGVNIENGYCSGGIAAVAFSYSNALGEPGAPLRISNCTVEGSVAGFWYVGGIVGVLRGCEELSESIVSVDIKGTFDRKKKYKHGFAEFAPEDHSLAHKQVSPLFEAYPPRQESFVTTAGGIVAVLGNEGRNISECSVRDCIANVKFSGDVSWLGSTVGFTDNSGVIFTNIQAEMDIKDLESSRPPGIFFF